MKFIFTKFKILFFLNFFMFSCLGPQTKIEVKKTDDNQKIQKELPLPQQELETKKSKELKVRFSALTNFLFASAYASDLVLCSSSCTSGNCAKLYLLETDGSKKYLCSVKIEFDGNASFKLNPDIDFSDKILKIEGFNPDGKYRSVYTMVEDENLTSEANPDSTIASPFISEELQSMAKNGQSFSKSDLYGLQKKYVTQSILPIYANISHQINRFSTTEEVASIINSSASELLLQKKNLDSITKEDNIELPPQENSTTTPEVPDVVVTQPEENPATMPEVPDVVVTQPEENPTTTPEVPDVVVTQPEENPTTTPEVPDAVVTQPEVPETQPEVALADEPLPKLLDNDWHVYCSTIDPIVSAWPGYDTENFVENTNGLQIQAELPLQTNFNGLGFSAGALLRPGCRIRYSYPNSAGNYAANKYNLDNIINEDVKVTLRKIASETSTSIRLIRANDIKTKLARYSELEDSSDTLQIFQGLPVSDSMITVILPPSWSRSRSKKYPILFSAFYGINVNLVDQEGPNFMRTIAGSVNENRDGAIGVLWNGDGDAGMSFTLKARKQFRDVLSVIENKFNGDKHNIVMTGGSRGGTTPLAMASNYEDADYTIRYIDAMFPASEIGTHGKLKSSTYSDVFWVFGHNTNDHEAWHSEWKGPNGVSAIDNYMLKTVAVPQSIDGDIPTTINKQHTLSADKFVDALKRQGTKLHLTIHTSDRIIPSPLNYGYYFKLKERGVPVQAAFTQFLGHNEPDLVFNERYERVKENLYALTDKNNPTLPEMIISTPKISAFSPDRGYGNYLVDIDLNGRVPFTLDIPPVAFHNDKTQLKTPIGIGGEPGTEYQIHLFDRTPNQEDIDPILEIINGKLSNLGSKFHFIKYPLLPEGHIISYFVMIKVPGGVWQQLTNENTVNDGKNEITTKVIPEPSMKEIGPSGELQSRHIAAVRDLVLDNVSYGIFRSERGVQVKESVVAASTLSIGETSSSGEVHISKNEKPILSVHSEGSSSQVVGELSNTQPVTKTVKFEAGKPINFTISGMDINPNDVGFSVSCFHRSGLLYDKCHDIFSPNGMSITDPGEDGVTNIYVISEKDVYLINLKFEKITYPLPTAKLTLSKNTVFTGDNFSVSWSSTNAEKCYLEINGILQDQAAGDLNGIEVWTAPETAQIIKYRGKCIGKGGEAFSSLNTLTIIYPPPSASLSLSTTSVVAGGSYVMNYSSTNADACYLEVNGVMSTTPAGALSGSDIVPAPPTAQIITYRGKCVGKGGTIFTPTVSINVYYPKPTASLTLSTLRPNAGQSVTMSWSSTNAQTCYLETNGVLDKNTASPASGSFSFQAPAAGMNLNYRAVCEGLGGSAYSGLLVMRVN